MRKGRQKWPPGWSPTAFHIAIEIKWSASFRNTFKLTFTALAGIWCVQKRWALITRAKTAEISLAKITNSTWHWRIRYVTSISVKSNECDLLLFPQNIICCILTWRFFGMLHRPIIPIVFGLHDHYDKISPSHSFINAAKFENMRQLAEYLILLDRNDTLYNQYFWWKPHFESRYKQKDVNIGMCHLCASLHNKDLPPKVYLNITQWWDEQSSCINSPPILWCKKTVKV